MYSEISIDLIGKNVYSNRIVYKNYFKLLNVKCEYHNSQCQLIIQFFNFYTKSVVSYKENFRQKIVFLCFTINKNN